MKILVYSYFPPLNDHLAGGAQRFLDGLLKALHRTGDAEITVLSPPLRGRELIPSRPGLQVLPELAVVDDDPTPEQAHHDLTLLDRYSRWADVVLTIDRHFPLQTQTPIILCLNNFSYGPETRSVFGLGWDAIVVPSEYLRCCLDWYFDESSWIGTPRPIRVIPCGVDQSPIDNSDRRQVRESLQLSNAEPYLVFPHRPDPDKGFETAVRAVLELDRTGDTHILLVPSPEPSGVWPHQRAYLLQRQQLVKDLGAEHVVRFHRWVRAKEIAAYLSLAEWSLCLSHLPEGFGLAVLESIAAGVPVVATPAGAVSELIPAGNGIELIEFGDADAVARIIAEGSSRMAIAQGQAFIASSFSWDTVAAKWLAMCSSVKKSDATYAVGESLFDGRTPPWRRRMPSGRVWHDYRMDWAITSPSKAIPHA